MTQVPDSVFKYVDLGFELAADYPDYAHNDSDLLDLYRYAGNAARNQGDLNTALEYLSAGSRFSESGNRSGFLPLPGKIESEYGNTLALAGNSVLGEERILRALHYLSPANISNETDEAFRGDALRYYCQVLSNLKDYPKMEVMARAAQSISGKLQAGKNTEASDLNNIGYALVYQGKLKEGRRYLNRALNIYRKNNNLTEQGHSYENFAEAERREGNYAAGIGYLRRAESCYHGLPEQPGLENALNPEMMIEAVMEVTRYGMILHRQDSLAFDLPMVTTAAARVDSLLGLIRYSVISEKSKRLLVSKLRPFHEQIIAFATDGFNRTTDQHYLDLGLHYLARSKSQVLNERRAVNQLLTLDGKREEIYVAPAANSTAERSLPVGKTVGGPR